MKTNARFAFSAMRFFLAACCVLLLAAAFLFFVPKKEQVRLLYAAGETSDSSAYDNFKQTLAANAAVEEKPLAKLSGGQLKGYDAVYLDPSLQNSDLLRQKMAELKGYVQAGGRLFLENGFAADFPADFLGAKQVVDVPADAQKLVFSYPQAAPDLQGMQNVFRLFADNFKAHIGMDQMPGFVWGKGMIPSTAQTLVESGGVSLMTVNRQGSGSVLLSSAFLPNRYFITGFDLKSGMDPARGFSAKLAEDASAVRPKPGTAYFDRNNLKLDSYFQFGFATANYQLRNAYLAYVSKDAFGYSVTKVLGPYGRPAMAHQNHFEALPAIGNKDGIQWAELLKQYNEIPSFSLVRGSYDWQIWHEDITVHLNTGTSAKPHFAGEYANSFYGSGARLADTGGKPLLLATYPERPSLSEPIALPYRAYPAFADWNGDGRTDLIAGSADGSLRVYPGAGPSAGAYANQPLPAGLAAPDAFGPAQRLPFTAAGGYAAPAAYDANGDGRPDLLIGSERGTVELALNQGGFTFSAPVPVLAGGRPLRVASYAAPAVGDVDGDGVPDLVVGDGEGGVTLFRGIAGQPASFAAGEPLVKLSGSGKFAAPSVRDLNGDGRADLAVGTGEGDVQVFLRDGAGWKAAGPLEGDTLNQVGSHALVGGHNAVPLWLDVNHDGKDDLVVGQLEFGPAYDVSDPNFPYRPQLDEFIRYAKDNYLELFPHLFFHNYKTSDQEKEELALHKESFAKLGLPWTANGTNQHTWRINNPDRIQTLKNENEQGLWFNFGFRPSDTPTEPPYGPDYMWGMPFLLADSSLGKPMLLSVPVPLLRLESKVPDPNEDVFRSYVAQDMPIDYFEHIEYHFPGRVGELKDFVEYLDRIRHDHNYNFMTETQMAQSSLTALSSSVTVTRSWGTYLVDRLKDKLRSGPHFHASLQPETAGVPAEAGDYRNTLGVRIEPGERLSGAVFRADSDIYTVQDGGTYAGLPGKTKISISPAQNDLHVVRSNVPLDIRKESARWTISLKGDGMQQIKLFSPVPLKIEGPDLKLEEDKRAHTYTVTHFGAAIEIRVNY